MPASISKGMIYGAAALALLWGPPPLAERGAPGSGRAAGRIAGRVEVGPELSSRRIRFHLYPDLIPASDLPVSRQEPQDEVKNVIVYLESVPPGADEKPAARAPAIMRQEGLSFVPHVVAVRVGSPVEFPNADPIFHNVFSLSKGATFDLGRYPEGESKSITFDKPGVVKVFCHIHSDMSGLIMVLDNSFFTTPDETGRYDLDELPPGEYTVVAWHERARPLKATIRVEPGQTSVLDLKIPLNLASKG